MINCALVYIYVSRQTKIDEDDFGGIQELVKEGLFTAFAVFLVSLIFSILCLFLSQSYSVESCLFVPSFIPSSIP